VHQDAATRASDVALALSDALAPRYRIEREVGTGGMATVYLARDLKHERDVAIKVFRPDVAAIVGGERFLDEIRTTAHLRHPHILPLFDSGSAAGALFYVMPFVDGESLRDRIRREGQLPTDGTVRILREVADALAYAHSRGIVHRDVKPDNVLISGRHVFLADFGVARALAQHAEGATVTGTGILVGTPAYMAPEQVAGGAIDHRTDIYALGAMAYELLAGVPPFTGASHEVVAAHLTRTADPLTSHRPDLTPGLAQLVMRCLEKQPDRRWQRVDDLLPVLEGLQHTTALAAAPDREARSRRLLPAAALIAIALGALVALWYTLQTRSTPDALAIGRITRVTTEPGLELDPAVAPDGKTIAYAAGPVGAMRIYVRQISGGRMVPLTDDGFASSQRWPQWSSDGARLAFQAGPQTLTPRQIDAGAAIYHVPALGGIPHRLFGSIPGGRAVAASWMPGDADIVFAGAEGLYAVSARGDTEPRLLVPGYDLHSARWSADGRYLAYVSAGGLFTFGEEFLGNVSYSVIWLRSQNGRTTALTSGGYLDTNPVWMPDNRTLLFISTRGGGRDIYRMELTSAGQPQGEPARLTSGLNAHGISLSADGTLLAYSSYATSSNIWSVELPEAGPAAFADARQITSGNEKIEKIVLSPDGRWLAYDSDRNGQADIWKIPVEGGTPEQVTRSSNHEFVNEWSPDGKELVFHSIREGSKRDVLVVSADGTRTELVTGAPTEDQHAGWGPDGNTIVYDSGETSEGSPWQAFIVTRERRGAPWGPPRQLTKDGSADPKWSPDGRFIAFTSRGQLRIISPDGTGQRVVVDGSAGGDQLEPAYPIWSRDSQTIYYKAYDRHRHSSIWSVPIGGGAPRLLLRFDDQARRSLRREFATDGRRIYFTVARDESDIFAMELVRK
jgi:serine/threonine-protein kinase